jgi:hypothetical protein
VNQAAEYRIYRAERSGGPFRWLNSSYLNGDASLDDQPYFTDENAGPDSTYMVTAVNADGRESAWPESPTSNQQGRSAD